jgi:hypothetical protein
MYQNGLGVVRDYAAALKWYRLAADQGLALSQNNLGAMFEYGVGVEPDRAVAYALYSFSASNNPSENNRAGANLSRLIASLSASELEAGQRLAQEMTKPGNLLRALDAYLEKSAGK